MKKVLRYYGLDHLLEQVVQEPTSEIYKDQFFDMGSFGWEYSYNYRKSQLDLAKRELEDAKEYLQDVNLTSKKRYNNLRVKKLKKFISRCNNQGTNYLDETVKKHNLRLARYYQDKSQYLIEQSKEISELANKLESLAYNKLRHLPIWPFTISDFQIKEYRKRTDLTVEQRKDVEDVVDLHGRYLIQKEVAKQLLVQSHELDKKHCEYLSKAGIYPRTFKFVSEQELHYQKKD